MHEEPVFQGRSLNATELDWLRDWILARQRWSRHQLAVGLCSQWQWETAAGRLKSFAARSFLIKLEQRGLIVLPPVRKTMRRRSWKKSFEAGLDFVPSVGDKLPEPVTATLSDLLPVKIVLCSSGSRDEFCFRSYLAAHHYLGFGKTVGENIQYLVQDRQGRDLACLLFGSAAWKAASRDAFIGWSQEARLKNLNQATNNTRFLILPWVKVPHLASHVLSKILRRLSIDWQEKYGHPIHLVETFVEQKRFRGTCYRAANWKYVGETKGRSRQDRDQTLSVPVKDIYLYPICKNFREVLCRFQ